MPLAEWQGRRVGFGGRSPLVSGGNHKCQSHLKCVTALPHCGRNGAFPLGFPPQDQTPMTRLLLAAAAAFILCAAVAIPSIARAQCGSASWYSLPGNRTANGERMNPSAMTAAHRSLPFGTKVKVTNRRNGRSVTVRINDRGPFIKGRIIDVSKAAARELGFVRAGHTQICIKRH